MKRLVIAGALALVAGGYAVAADLPYPRPVPQAPVAYIPVVPAYSWTGFYIGINGGGGFGNSNWLDPVLGNSGNFNTSVFLIGGTVGANYPIGQFVLGVEGDGDWQNLDGTTTGGSCPPGLEQEQLARDRPRPRRLCLDRVLFYGGGAPSPMCKRAPVRCRSQARHRPADRRRRHGICVRAELDR